MARTKQQQDDGVHRLTEIVVEEVSLVDRPANLQPFLIVKRDATAVANGEIVIDDDGNLVTAGKANEGGKDDKPAGAAKATHEAFRTSMKAARKNIDDALKEIDDERIAIAKTDAAIADLNKAKTSYSKADKSAPTGTKKAGAKMSAARFGELKRAVEILLALRDSLAPAVKEEAGKSEKKKKGDGDGDRTAKLDKATAAKIDNLVDSVTTLTKSVETHERKLRQGVRKGKRRGVVSNALSVEKGQSSDDDDTTWPMDLNREETRKNTPSHRSFFDR